MRALTDRPFGVNLVLDWPQEERLRQCLDAGVGIVSTTWGDPAPLVRIAHEGGAIFLHTVGDVAEARRAVDAGVDVIVAQGWEAGGHVRARSRRWPSYRPSSTLSAPIPVVAAGGIGDGRGLAAVLMLGASAGWLGTRFVMAAEAPALHPLSRPPGRRRRDVDRLLIGLRRRLAGCPAPDASQQHHRDVGGGRSPAVRGSGRARARPSAPGRW